MKKIVISVSKLKDFFEGELFAYPVQSVYNGNIEGHHKGFYMGIYPVFKEGYGIDYHKEFFRMKEDKMDNKIRVGLKEKETILLSDESWLMWEDEYYLAPHTVTGGLKKFGFTEEQISASKVEINIPVSKSVEFTESELDELIQKLEGTDISEQLMSKLRKQQELKFPIWLLRSHIEKGELIC